MDIESNQYLEFEIPEDNLEPFYQYILEDKSKYKRACDVINPKTESPYHDPDGDWLVGESGGFMPNINFIFKQTKRLRQSALFYAKNKRYTFFEEDSPEHTKFRKREEDRRKRGFKANCKLLHKDINLYDSLIAANKTKEAEQLLKPLRISGEHYNFINYGRIILLEEHKVVAGSVGADKLESTPIFIDSQYWIMKAKEFAKANGYHVMVLKSRRKGMSYMEGIDSANEVNLYPKVTVIHGAFDKAYVTKGNSLSPMAKIQLEFFEEHTPFHRNFPGQGLLKKTIEEMKVGYKKKDGSPGGYMGTILAVSFKDNPDAAIGKDGRKIKLDELSAFPNFEPVMDVTEPATRTGAYLTGFIFAGGTGGSKSGSWAQFERNYNSPEVYGFMPFENLWDSNSRHRKVGYFMPYWFGLQGTYKGKYSLDEDGNSIYSVAMAISRMERAEKATSTGGRSTERFLKYCSQYANRPSEAFSTASDNIFSSATLTQHIEVVRASRKDIAFKDGYFFEQSDGKTMFKSMAQIEMMVEENPEYRQYLHPYIENFPILPDDDPYGCMRMFHAPYRDREGNVPDDLYAIAYDPMGKDIDSKELKLYHSLNAFYVISLPNDYGVSPNTISLIYVGRPPKMEQVDKHLLHACRYYNAKAIVEVDRGNTVSNFRAWGALNWLIKDPTYTVAGKNTPDNAGYGINIGGGDKAEEGMKMLAEYFYNSSAVKEDGTIFYDIEKIWDLPTLLEAAKYAKGLNVDRLSALRAFMFYYKAFRLKRHSEARHNYEGTTADEMCLN